MRVRFKTNLGSIDARKLGLDYTKCQSGMTCEVGDEVGEKLLSGNLATRVAETIKAVPDKPAIAEAESPKIAGDESGPAKPEPQGVQGTVKNDQAANKAIRRLKAKPNAKK